MIGIVTIRVHEPNGLLFFFLLRGIHLALGIFYQSPSPRAIETLILRDCTSSGQNLNWRMILTACKAFWRARQKICLQMGRVMSW
jgi:hypothetical protein